MNDRFVGTPVQAVKIKSEDRILDATLIRRGDSNDLGILFLHGMTSSKVGYVEIAKQLRAEAVFLALSLGGHGDSTGDFNKLVVSDGVLDGINAYDFLRSKLSPEAKVVIVGASVGSAIAAIVSKQRKVDGLALRSPATYTEEMLGMSFAEIMSKESNIFQNVPSQITPSVQAMKTFDGNLLVIASEKDHVIPRNIPDDYLKAATKVKSKEDYVIKDAGHDISEPKYKRQFIEILDQWLLKYF